MPFSDPLCAQYSLSVIKNLSRGNRRFFRVVGRTKGKIFLCKFIISNGAPFVNTMPPPPLRGRPPSPIRETPRSREPHIRGRPPSLVSFLVARDPPRSHAGCATETTQIRKPARIGPQAFPKASPKPQKALRQAPKALRQATSPKCTENPPKNRIIFAKDPSIKNHPRKSPRG